MNDLDKKKNIDNIIQYLNSKACVEDSYMTLKKKVRSLHSHRPTGVVISVCWLVLLL